jgi:hypothetical protein
MLTDEGEGVRGGEGHVVLLLAGESGLDLVEPAEGGQMRGRGDAPGRIQEVEGAAGKRHGGREYGVSPAAGCGGFLGEVYGGCGERRGVWE